MKISKGKLFTGQTFVINLLLSTVTLRVTVDQNIKSNIMLEWDCKKSTDFLLQNQKQIAKIGIAFRIIDCLATYHNCEEQVINLKFNHNYLCAKIKQELKSSLQDKFSEYDNISFTEIEEKYFLIEWRN